MNFVTRSEPAPASLAVERQKASGSYCCEDVVIRLKVDFHDKCYICGLKGLQDPQVEHLRPHRNGSNIGRKFDWHNLFWSCGHCNSVKNKNIYDDMIIDCCTIDPESIISFRVTKDNVQVRAKAESDIMAVRTAFLVEEVFNIRNTGMRIIKSEQRWYELSRELSIFDKYLRMYRNNHNSKVACRMLRSLLRRESAFSEFKRQYIRDHMTDYDGLIDMLK